MEGEKRGFRLSTFVMKKNENEEVFEENIREYIKQIYDSKNRLQAVDIRKHALECIDEFRWKSFEEIDQHIQYAREGILDAFDQYQNKIRKNQKKCSHQLKSSVQQIEISINRKKLSLYSIDFGRDFTVQILANLSSSISTDNAMILCENDILIYSQNANQLFLISLINRKQIQTIQFNKNTFIRDLCFVNWLSKCLVITNQEIYLLDYHTLDYESIEIGYDYRCGTIDNRRKIFYLIKQSTIYKYDRNCLVTLQADQYPIDDGYQCECLVLDNQTNDYLALLVHDQERKTYILVYSTKSLSNGYLYKIVIEDKFERKWICSNGNFGWLIGGNSSETCFDIGMNGLNSLRIFHCREIENILLTSNSYQIIIRTKTDIFLLIKKSFVQSF